jgi:hypothetical protein
MGSDAGSIEPKRDGDLGRLTAVMGSVRPTFERRQRLRQCLIKADAENLPDYELLQVMLFTSNPHANVESLVGQLLDRFGTLAEVLSADTEALGAAGLSLPASCVRQVQQVQQVQQIGHGHGRWLISGQEQHPFVRSAGPSVRSLIATQKASGVSS